MESRATRFIYCSFLFLLAGYINCQSNELDINELEKKLNTLPGLEQFNSSKLPTEEDVEKVIKEKCEKNGGGEEAFIALKNQQELLKECLEQHLNATQIQIEIEESKKTGSMDDVFGKYCKMYPEIYKCFESTTDKVKACLDANEKEALNKALNITGELRDFICFKDGDRIAMFIAEGGVECLESRKDALQECANKTIGSRIPTELSISNMPTFLFSDRDCSDFDTIRKCFNTELEKCKDSTPANIVDAFFKFLKKHTPCSDNTSMLKTAESKDNASSAIAVSSYVLLTSLIVSKIFRAV